MVRSRRFGGQQGRGGPRARAEGANENDIDRVGHPTKYGDQIHVNPAGPKNSDFPTFFRHPLHPGSGESGRQPVVRAAIPFYI